MGCLGQLHVSVVEGKALRMRPDARPSVLLQIGEEQARTAPLKNLSCKWLAEFRLDVPSEDAFLTVALFDDHSASPVGKSLVSIRDLTTIGATVQWVTMKDFSGKDVGQICLVLRFLKGQGTNGARRDNGSNSFLENGESNSERYEENGDFGNKAVNGGPKKNQSSGSGRNRLLITAASAVATVALAVFAWKSHQKRKSRFYEVQDGDTLCSIAAKYGLSPDDVFEANMHVFSEPDRIFPGDKMYIP